MPKRFSAFCLFAAWLCASGAVLNGVQVYAWGRMFVTYVHQVPVTQAATETFDGSKPCPICQALQHVREQTQPDPAPVSSSTDAVKLVLIAEDVPVVVFARERAPWPDAHVVAPPARVKPVLLPPPRPLAAGWTT